MTAGLDRVDALEAGHGYADVEVSAVGQVGASPWMQAQLEAGYHPLAGVDLFTFGRADAQFGGQLEWQAGFGARVRW